MNFSFFTVFLKNRNISSKIKRSKVTENAAFFKETKSATMNIFRFFFYFLFKSFVKVEFSYVFTINLFTRAETAPKSELSYKSGVFY